MIRTDDYSMIRYIDEVISLWIILETIWIYVGLYNLGRRKKQRKRNVYECEKNYCCTKWIDIIGTPVFYFKFHENKEILDNMPIF